MIITNSFSLNMLADTSSVGIIIKEVPVDQAKREIRGCVESAVGHADTAAVFAAQLGVEIPPARITVSLKGGDRIIVGQYIGPRLPEGCKTLPEGATIKWLLVTVADRYLLVGENDTGYPEIFNEVFSDGPIWSYGPLHLQ